MNALVSFMLFLIECRARETVSEHGSKPFSFAQAHRIAHFYRFSEALGSGHATLQTLQKELGYN